MAYYLAFCAAAAILLVAIYAVVRRVGGNFKKNSNFASFILVEQRYIDQKRKLMLFRLGKLFYLVLVGPNSDLLLHKGDYDSLEKEIGNDASKNKSQNRQ